VVRKRVRVVGESRVLMTWSHSRLPCLSATLFLPSGGAIHSRSVDAATFLFELPESFPFNTTVATLELGVPGLSSTLHSTLELEKRPRTPTVAVGLKDGKRWPTRGFFARCFSPACTAWVSGARKVRSYYFIPIDGDSRTWPVVHIHARDGLGNEVTYDVHDVVYDAHPPRVNLRVDNSSDTILFRVALEDLAIEGTVVLVSRVGPGTVSLTGGNTTWLPWRSWGLQDVFMPHASLHEFNVTVTPDPGATEPVSATVSVNTTDAYEQVGSASAVGVIDTARPTMRHFSPRRLHASAAAAGVDMSVTFSEPSLLHVQVIAVGTTVPVAGCVWPAERVVSAVLHCPALLPAVYDVQVDACDAVGCTRHDVAVAVDGTAPAVLSVDRRPVVAGVNMTVFRSEVRQPVSVVVSEPVVLEAMLGHGASFHTATAHASTGVADDVTFDIPLYEMLPGRHSVTLVVEDLVGHKADLVSFDVEILSAAFHADIDLSTDFSSSGQVEPRLHCSFMLCDVIVQVVDPDGLVTEVFRCATMC